MERPPHTRTHARTHVQKGQGELGVSFPRVSNTAGSHYFRKFDFQIKNSWGFVAVVLTNNGNSFVENQVPKYSPNIPISLRIA